MEHRNLIFEEEKIELALNDLEDSLTAFLEHNGMLEDCYSYPADDISRIMFKSVLDTETVIILEYTIKTYDLSELAETRPFIWQVLEWPILNFDRFVCLNDQMIASEEQEKLKEIIKTDKDKEIRRL
jgi:hypothetical protein